MPTLQFSLSFLKLSDNYKVKGFAHKAIDRKDGDRNLKVSIESFQFPFVREIKFRGKIPVLLFPNELPTVILVFSGLTQYINMIVIYLSSLWGFSVVLLFSFVFILYPGLVVIDWSQNH